MEGPCPYHSTGEQKCEGMGRWLLFYAQTAARVQTGGTCVRSCAACLPFRRGYNISRLHSAQPCWIRLALPIDDIRANLAVVILQTWQNVDLAKKCGEGSNSGTYTAAFIWACATGARCQYRRVVVFETVDTSYRVTSLGGGWGPSSLRPPSPIARYQHLPCIVNHCVDQSCVLACTTEPTMHRRAGERLASARAGAWACSSRLPRTCMFFTWRVDTACP